MWSKAAKAALAAVLLVVASTAVAAKAKLGFATEATSIGFISPVLECLKVITLWPAITRAWNVRAVQEHASRPKALS